jgi:hypothetical protein
MASERAEFKKKKCEDPNSYALKCIKEKFIKQNEYITVR